MTISSTIVVAGSGVILIGAFIVVAIHSRNAQWLKDRWLELNAHPKSNWAFAAFYAAAIIACVLLGVVLLQLGHIFGWALIISAAALAVVLAFYIWVGVRRPGPRTDSVHPRSHE